MGSLCDNCRRSGRVWCPHNAALEIRTRIAGSLKQDMFGPTPPNLFVGHNFYPKVYWGPLVSAVSPNAEQGEESGAAARTPNDIEDPAKMYGMTLQSIIESRANMVRGMKRDSVKATSRMLEEAQQTVMSIKPVDVETHFSKKPVFSLEFDAITHPVGASAPIEKFKMADNPEIPKKVDELHDDGVLATEALRELLLSGFDVHYLSKLLTAGILGKKENRKLVPTKWSITATDDMAGKRFMESLRDYRELEEIRVYSNQYLDNHFEILLLPGNWEYEQFETALTKEIEELYRKRQDRAALKFSSSLHWEAWGANASQVNMSEEYEPFAGRSDYAERQGGGYYAARFAVAEGLYLMNRQARAIVFREIGTGYSVPVGVWEVRENVRHAFLNTPEKFATREEALLHLSEKLSVPLREYKKLSRVLLQRRLTEF